MKPALLKYGRPPLYGARNAQTIPQRINFVLSAFGMAMFLKWLLGGVAFLALVSLLAIYHIWYMNQRGEESDRIEIITLYFLFYVFAFNSIWGFIGHTFLADTVAESIGWDTGSPFQTELAFYHLSYGVIGAAVAWYRNFYWLAMAIGKSIFLYGAAYTHIRDIIVNANYAPNNVGFQVLYLSGLILPTLILVLTFLYWRSRSTTHMQQESASASGQS